ncbi:MAG TPA: matrixin family metalloprotease [Polyangiaceae bacterium]|nr:matrixin family metalloprotease [Polyangiaceae bacterium]
MLNQRGFSIRPCAGLLVLAALLVPRPAAAYCLSMGCDKTKPELACSLEGGCMVNHLPLFWPTSCISFSVQEDGSRADNISYDTAKRVIDTAFRTWISADCGGGALPSISIETTEAVACDHIEYNTKGANANVFLFRDDEWPYTNTLDALALTTVSFNPETGAIYDVDVEVNSFEANLTVDEANARDDLPSILTHEVGHFLGLSHSQVETATMRKYYETGNLDLRTLDVDDVAGICAAYPPDRDLPPANCEPRHGFSRECATDEEAGCCAIHATRPRKSGPLAVLLAGVGLSVLRRRVARRRCVG